MCNLELNVRIHCLASAVRSAYFAHVLRVFRRHYGAIIISRDFCRTSVVSPERAREKIGQSSQEHRQWISLTIVTGLRAKISALSKS